MKKKELAFYRDLLGDIKARVRQAQHRAALSANAEMILMYWDIGRMVAIRQKEEGWGAGVIPRLATDLKNELPEQKGFSERNIKRMLRFYREYSALDEMMPRSAALLPPSPDQIGARAAPQHSKQANEEEEGTSYEPLTKVPQTAAQLALPPKILLGIPWFHHVILIEKLKDLPIRYWYARQAFEQGWTRDTLTAQIKNNAHKRQGAAITNFATTMPEAHASIAQGLLKDPYLFAGK